MKTYKAVNLFILLICIISSNAQDGLVAYWSFDELNNNNLYDYSENGHYATNYGGIIVPGIIGNALYFDGVDDYVRIPQDGENPHEVFSTLGKGSISLWFRANHIPTTYGIAPILYYGADEQCNFFDAANQGLIIELGHSPIYMGSEAVFFTIWKNGCTYPSFCFDSFTAVSTNEWHHYVVVVGNSYNTGYLDGVEMTGRRYSFGSSSDSQFFQDAILHEKMWLGKGYWDNTTQYFNGSIDELKIFNQPLTSSEVIDLYISGMLSINQQENNISKITIHD